MTRRLVITSAFLVALSVGIQVDAHAATHARAPFAGPSATCDFEHRMEIQIIDGIWFECMCLALANGWDCAWVELPEPAVANLKRRIRKHLAHPRLIVRYALPQVTA